MNKDFTAVAKQYAEALFDLAGDNHSEREVLDELKLVAQVIHANPEFKVVLGHPSVPPAEKKEILAESFYSRVSDLMQRFLSLLSDRRRLYLVPFVQKEFERLWLQKQDILTGTLTYVERPEARVMAEIRAKLKTRLGKEKIELEEIEDKSLIGGFVLRIGDQVIDGSLKGRLGTIQKSLLSV